jgi:hypothetical protein
LRWMDTGECNAPGSGEGTGERDLRGGDFSDERETNASEACRSRVCDKHVRRDGRGADSLTATPNLAQAAKTERHFETPVGDGHADERVIRPAAGTTITRSCPAPSDRSVHDRPPQTSVGKV